MARDTVVLSPEHVNTGRREGLADGVTIATGSFVLYSSGGFTNQAAALGSRMLAVGNVAVAGDIDYVYADGENVFVQSLPPGALVNVKAAAATYTPGDIVELATGGIATALAAGVPVGVVPSFGGEVIGAGDSLMIELL